MLKDCKEGMTFVNFNYDLTTLFVATSEEVKVFRLQDFRKIFEIKIASPFLIEQLFGTDILCVVSKSSPQKMELIEMTSNNHLKSKTYPESITGIKSNKFVMVTDCNGKLCAHDMSNYKAKFKLELTKSSNDKCLIALSQASGKESYLVFTVSETAGDIEVFDTNSKKCVANIRAHKSQVVILAFHPTELVLATASKNGTVIRLISIPSGTNLFEFRRGIQRSADIYSLSFSRDSNFLVSSGSTGTIHVFKYALPWKRTKKQSWSEYIGGSMKSCVNYFLAPSSDMTIKYNEDWTSYVGDVISSSAGCIPKHVYEVCSQLRSFVKVRLTGENIRNISTVIGFDDALHAAVFTEDGFFSMYKINEGKSSLISKYSPISEMSVELHGSSEEDTTPKEECLSN